MSDRMAFIRINDIFDELMVENKKLYQCLNVLISFKSFVDLIYDKFKTDFDSKTVEMFEKFNNEVEDVLKRNEIELNNYNIDKNMCSDQSILKSCELISNFVSNKSKNVKQIKNKRKTVKTESIIRTDENQKLICSFIGCGKTLGSRDTLRVHMKRHSNSSTDRNHSSGVKSKKKVKSFVCDLCEKPFASHSSLKTHKVLRHSESDQILICEFENCGKTYKSELSLKNHQRIQHLTEKSYFCLEPNCGFKAISAAYLRQHNQRVHLKERAFKCPVFGCGKAYRGNADLVNHMLCHNSERSFKCRFNGCQKSFMNSDGLRQHSYVHSERRFRCDWPGCDYTSKLKGTLNEHQMIHSLEPKFVCHWPQCHKKFKFKQNLSTHLRIHTNDKRYSCVWPGCQYRCTDSSNLLKHKKVHKISNQ